MIGINSEIVIRATRKESKEINIQIKFNLLLLLLLNVALLYKECNESKIVGKRVSLHC